MEDETYINPSIKQLPGQEFYIATLRLDVAVHIIQYLYKPTVHHEGCHQRGNLPGRVPPEAPGALPTVSRRRDAVLADLAS